MKSCFYYLLFSLPLFVFNSCSNELDVLADYEENAAIYCLLDPSQPLQFAKINKVFMNPNGNARDIAKIADSLYFDSLAPVLVEVENGAVRKTIPLFRANILLKDSGIFANSPNYLYVTNVPISSKYKYSLEMRLPKSNKYVTANTSMVVMPPFSLLNPVNLAQRIIAISTVSSIPIQFQTGLNGRVYDAYFNFNYMEVNKADTNIKTVKTIRWKVLRSYRTQSDKGNELVSQRVPGILFYNRLIDEIPLNPAVTRRFMPCSFEFIGGNQELDTYMEASVPSIGIVQKQTDYTNIKNGVGLFGSRNTIIVDQVQLSDLNKGLIINDDAYKHLGFE
jgi:hypothetical protein